MRKTIVCFVALTSILFGSLAAGSPTMSEAPAASIAGIDLGTPAHHASRVEAALPQILTPGALLRLLVQLIGAAIVVVLLIEAVPLRTHLGRALAAGRRGPPASNG